MKPVIAIDLGGTAIKAALVQDGEILSSGSIPAHSSEGLSPQLPRVEELLKKLCADKGLAPGDCAGIGMAVPFFVDPVASKILSVPKEKYFDAADLDLGDWCQKTFGLKLKIENDAHAACLGEWRSGAAKGTEDFVMFTLGTGIGCSVVFRGHPIRGKRFQAGVMGHLISDPNSHEPCVCCPAEGCFEALSASRSLPGHARIHPDFSKSPLSLVAEIDFKAVFQYAAAGDSTATSVRDRVINYWAALALNASYAFDPDLIIFGGAVAKDADVFLPVIQKYLAKNAWSVRPPDVAAAALGNHAGTVGIASLFSNEPQYL